MEFIKNEVNQRSNLCAAHLALVNLTLVNVTKNEIEGNFRFTYYYYYYWRKKVRAQGRRKCIFNMLYVLVLNYYQILYRRELYHLCFVQLKKALSYHKAKKGHDKNITQFFWNLHSNWIINEESILKNGAQPRSIKMWFVYKRMWMYEKV